MQAASVLLIESFVNAEVVQEELWGTPHCTAKVIQLRSVPLMTAFPGILRLVQVRHRRVSSLQHVAEALSPVFCLLIAGRLSLNADSSMQRALAQDSHAAARYHMPTTQLRIPNANAMNT
ncbi:hypothetical protein FIBSPDRAFT_507828 [Athelia psychrophila]|uniref:Uncharacterized protein n=1 Tax=Athelia psychrophila TaxID=1759441 RepID=A0A167TNF6_9AGAM|nr:hypothetical protein FIBSPDRAFT_507828 [Fibularhizoctonia sp. CBS 109695]